MNKKVKKKIETNDSFEHISDSLGTTFDGEEVEIDEMKELETKTNDLVLKDKSEITFVEGQYIVEELKSLISNLNVAMNTLQQDLKVGAEARKSEVFAGLANSKSIAIKELISMEKTLLEAKIKTKKDTPTNVTNNLNISSKELLEMVTNAKKNNSLKKIKAEFKISENE